MIIRKLTEADAESLWKLRLYALETDPASFGGASQNDSAALEPKSKHCGWASNPLASIT